MMSISDLEQRIAAWLDGRISPEESQALQQQLRASPEARAMFRRYAQLDAVIREVADVASRSIHPSSGAPGDGVPSPAAPNPVASAVRRSLLRGLLAIATVIIAVLAAALYFQHVNSHRSIATAERKIARITGLSGSLMWTGDGGQIVHDLSVGTELPGGTIEGMAPDSWFELEFNDGSTVMISGDSMLTFSDFEQKELHLKEGRLSASVVPQPAGKPMLIHTRSALLKVLGTQFEVEVGLASTALHVSTGKVQLKRLSDGATVDVPARHRVFTAAEGGMSPQLVPDAVHEWKSQLQLGPDKTYGQWSPATGENPASLKAIPFVPREHQSVTLNLLGLPVIRTDGSPVIVKPDSRFVVRGRLRVAADVYFGIGVARPNGEFAGKFLARQPAVQFRDDSSFEAVFRLDEFGLDPCVWDRKDELPDKPDNLVVTCAWSFTHAGGPTGLEITEVELIPADQTIPTNQSDASR